MGRKRWGRELEKGGLVVEHTESLEPCTKLAAIDKVHLQFNLQPNSFQVVFA